MMWEKEGIEEGGQELACKRSNARTRQGKIGIASIRLDLRAGP
jgi:hypothetical protein